MLPTSKEPGKLGLILVKSLIENRPDEGFAIEKAWQAASGRLWNKWADPRFWLATFDEVPENEKLLDDLKKAVIILYDHPADTSFARVVRQILQDQRSFSTVTVLKTVREYTETLIEELFLADANFRETLQNSQDPLSREIVKRAAPLLTSELPTAEEKEIKVQPPESQSLPEEEQAEAPASSTETKTEVTAVSRIPSEIEPEGMPDKAIAEGTEKAALEFQESEEKPAEIRIEPAASVEPPIQPVPPSSETKSEELTEHQVPPVKRKPKAYEAWATASSATRELLKIQQAPEEMQKQAEPDSPEAKGEETAEPEMPPIKAESVTEEIDVYHQARELRAEAQSTPTEPDAAELVEDETPPFEPGPDAEEFPVSQYLMEELHPETEPAPPEEKAGEISEGLITPAEIQIRAELASAAEQSASLSSKRRKTIFQSIAKLFSRPEKTPVIPPLSEEPQVEAIPVPSEPEEPEDLSESQEFPTPIELPEIRIEPEEMPVIQQLPEEPQVEAVPVSFELQPEELPENQELTKPDVLPEIHITPEEMPVTSQISEEPQVEAVPVSFEPQPEELLENQELTKPDDLPEINIQPEETPVIPLLSEEPQVEASPVIFEVKPEELPENQEMPALAELPEIKITPEELPVIPQLSEEPQPGTVPVTFEAKPEEMQEIQEAPEEIQPEPILAPTPMEAEEITAVTEKRRKPAERIVAQTRKKSKQPEPTRIPISPHFVGRVNELQRLAGWLKKGKLPVVIGQASSFTSMGGPGKSRLTREYADKFTKEYKGGVFWFNFTDPELIPYQIAALAEGSKDRPYKIRLNQVLSEWKEKTPRLLIFDHCEDPDLLASWIPSKGGCKVLVTSRRNEWDPAEKVEFLPLEGFKRAESLAFLQELCRDADVEVSSLDAIAAELGDLPLALRMAGSCLASGHPTLSPEDYLNKLHQIKAHPHQFLPKSKTFPSDYDIHVALALKICLDLFNLENETDQTSMRLLHWMAYCAPGELIQKDFLQSLARRHFSNENSFEASWQRLVDLGVIEETKTGQYSIHPITADLVQRFLPNPEELAHFEQSVLSAAVEANRTKSFESMQPLLPHLKNVVDQAIAANKDGIAARLSNELGYHLEKVADFPGAQYYFERALDINIKTLGQVHPETAICLNNLGHLLSKMGDLRTARLYYEQALENRRKLLGEEHLDTARSFNNLGYLLQSMGSHKEALSNYEKALSIRRKTLGEKHPETAVSLNNLGALSQAMGDFSAARSYFEQALLIRKEVCGEEHPDTAASMNDLGCLFTSTGEFGKAKSYLEQALVIRKNYFGEEHPETARSLNNLGELMEAKGTFPAAQSYFEQALNIRRKMLGEDDLETAASLHNLGSLFQTEKKPAKAQPFLEAALAIRMKVQGQAHPEVAANLEQLGQISKARGNQIGAEKFTGQATAMRKALEKEKRPLFSHLGRRGRTVVASLFVFAVAVMGVNLLLPGPTPITLNWNLGNAGEIALLQPLKLFARRTPTPTPSVTFTLTSTSTFTFTPTASSTRTRYFVPIKPSPTAAAKNIEPSATRTIVFWTLTFTPPPPPQDNSPTNTPEPLVPSDTPVPTNTPTLHIILPPTDTPTLHIVIPPTDTPVPPPTDTPVPTDTTGP